MKLELTENESQREETLEKWKRLNESKKNFAENKEDIIKENDKLKPSFNTILEKHSNFTFNKKRQMKKIDRESNLCSKNENKCFVWYKSFLFLIFSSKQVPQIDKIKELNLLIRQKIEGIKKNTISKNRKKKY